MVNVVKLVILDYNELQSYYLCPFFIYCIARDSFIYTFFIYLYFTV